MTALEAPALTAPRARRSPRRRWPERVLFHATGLVVAFLFLAPVAWTLLAAFKQPGEANRPPLPPWPVSGVSVANYLTLDNFGGGILHHALNSFVVSAATALLTIVVSLLAGYGFSRMRFPLKGTLFVLVLATIMIPFQSILTPLFLILARLGLQNTLTGLVLIYVTLQLPFSVFMMRNAFDTVPKEIEEAARIEGVRGLRLLVYVLLPLVFPGVVTVGLFAFLNAWNEFLAALVLLTDESKYTLPVLMTAVRSGRFGSIDWGAVQAGVSVMLLPCLALFLALQRFYIRGLTAGAVK